MKKISVITPCYNEEVNVEICAQELRKVMREQLPGYDYEHIFADNASTDSTLVNYASLRQRMRKSKLSLTAATSGLLEICGTG